MKALNKTIIYSNQDLIQCGETSLSRDEFGFMSNEEGWFKSNIYDSGHHKTRWDRLIIEGNLTDFDVQIWIHDQKEIVEECENMNVTLSTKAKRALLNNFTGRYLRFIVKLHKDNNVSNLSSYQITFPYQSLTHKLPQMYQGNHDLEVFFAPFEDIYEDLQSKIRNLPCMFDPNLANDEQIINMCRFLDLNTLNGIKISTLRKLLCTKDVWMNQRGYYDTLLMWNRVFTERNCILFFDYNLYIINAYKNEAEAKQLEDFLKNELPFGIIGEFVWLEDSYLDMSYLDIGLCMNMKEREVFDGSFDGCRLEI